MLPATLSLRFPSIHHLPCPKLSKKYRHPCRCIQLNDQTTIFGPPVVPFLLLLFFTLFPVALEMRAKKTSHSWLLSSPFGVIQKPLSSIHHPLLTVCLLPLSSHFWDAATSTSITLWVSLFLVSALAWASSALCLWPIASLWNSYGKSIPSPASSHSPFPNHS